MKLTTAKRSTDKKSELTKLRLAGMIPAIVYHKGQSGEPIAVQRAEYDAIIRQVKAGHLSTQKITLVDENGKEKTVILKEIQYHPTTYVVLHLDFEELHEKTPVNVKVPIECKGVVDCVGIKLGGVLRQVIRSLKVRCLPKDIPDAFKVDVQPLGIKESRRLSDLTIPETVRPLADLSEVAVVIAKR